MLPLCSCRHSVTQDCGLLQNKCCAHLDLIVGGPVVSEGRYDEEEYPLHCTQEGFLHMQPKLQALARLSRTP